MLGGFSIPNISARGISILSRWEKTLLAHVLRGGNTRISSFREIQDVWTLLQEWDTDA